MEPMEEGDVCWDCGSHPTLPGEPYCVGCRALRQAAGTWVAPPTHVGRQRLVVVNDAHYEQNERDALGVAYRNRRFVIDYTGTAKEKVGEGTTVSRVGIFVNDAEMSVTDERGTGWQGRWAPSGGPAYNWGRVSNMLETLGLVQVGTTAALNLQPRVQHCPCSVHNRSSESRGVGAALNAWMQLNEVPSLQDRFVIAVTGSIPCEHCMTVMDFLNSRSL